MACVRQQRAALLAAVEEHVQPALIGWLAMLEDYAGHVRPGPGVHAIAMSPAVAEAILALVFIPVFGLTPMAGVMAIPTLLLGVYCKSPDVPATGWPQLTGPPERK